jgi:hypothetical protein
MPPIVVKSLVEVFKRRKANLVDMDIARGRIDELYVLLKN